MENNIFDVKIGQVVISKMGRDKNRFFMITKADENYVYLADGKIRRLSAPKKKRKKHVNVTKTFLDITLIENDKNLYRLIKPFNENAKTV